jgi:predicted ester cyclase
VRRGRWAVALVFTAAPSLAAPQQENPAEWQWPSVVKDDSVRQSIINGGYSQQELRNIRTELAILEGISVRRVAPVSGGPPPAGAAAGSGRWPPYFASDIRFSGRAMRNLEKLFGGSNEIDRGIPDRTNRVVGIIAKGDRVWITWMIEGHHTGSMFGLPPTGKALQAREISMLRFKDDKIAELDMMADELGLYIQAGGKPATSK